MRINKNENQEKVILEKFEERMRQFSVVNKAIHCLSHENSAFLRMITESWSLSLPAVGRPVEVVEVLCGHRA